MSMNAIAATAHAAAAPAPAAAPRTGTLVFTALAGSFLANMSAQFTGTNIADIQGGLGASADEVSWATTLYSAANFFGFVASPVLARTFGLRRLFLASAVAFAIIAWLSSSATSLPFLLVMRALHGFVGGMFGPMAFTALFRAWGGSPRLPFGLALLAFVLLVSVNAGPVASGYIEAALGWRSLFLLQGLSGVLLIFAGLRWLPASPVNKAELKSDWIAALLFAVATSSLLMVVSQGTRRFWFDSPIIATLAAIGIGAGIGFVVMYFTSPMRIVNLRKFADRRFAVPITMNFIVRATFAITVYLIPLLLGYTQGYRPLQTAGALWWNLVPQILAFLLAWSLVNRFDGRVSMLVGVLACFFGVALGSDASNLTAGAQLHASLALIGAGQMLFLVPGVMIGAGSLKPEDGPTAAILFNMTTVGGTAIGVGMLTHFTTEREKFHSNVLVEHVSWLDPSQADRLTALADKWSARTGDETLAMARAIAQVAASVRREAWLLAINDAFVLVAVLLLFTGLLVTLLGPVPPPVRVRTGATP